MSLLGGFGRSAHTRVWAVLDGLRSKELKQDCHYNLVDVTEIDRHQINELGILELDGPLEEQAQ